MSKHGVLKGNSGLMFDETGKCTGHISAPYNNNGMVFVEIQDHDWGIIWKRMPLEDAKAGNHHIIKCCQCDNPATSLDHLWPYHSEMNLCDEHDYKG